MYPAVTKIQIKPYINFLTINLKAGIPVNFGTQGTFISIAASSGVATDLIQIKAFRGHNTILDVTGIDDYWVFKMPGYDQEYVANYFDTLQLYSPNIDATVELYLGSGDVSIPGALAVVADIKKLQECVLVDTVTSITNTVKSRPDLTSNVTFTSVATPVNWTGSILVSPFAVPTGKILSTIKFLLANTMTVAPTQQLTATLYGSVTQKVYAMTNAIWSTIYIGADFNNINLEVDPADTSCLINIHADATAAGSYTSNSLAISNYN